MNVYSEVKRLYSSFQEMVSFRRNRKGPKCQMQIVSIPCRNHNPVLTHSSSSVYSLRFQANPHDSPRLHRRRVSSSFLVNPFLSGCHAHSCQNNRPPRKSSSLSPPHCWSRQRQAKISRFISLPSQAHPLAIYSPSPIDHSHSQSQSTSSKWYIH